MAKYFQSYHTVFVVVIFLVYVALRLWNLTDSCLWFDEIFSIHAAEMNWRDLFWFVARDLIHPPLFYALLKLWISIGGESLFWLRLFPVAFAAAAVLPFLRLIGELDLFSDLKQRFWSGCLALSFLAVNGSCIKYAQEVRMYSPLMCLAVFSMWLFARFLNGKKGLAILTVVNVSLVYTHYFGWFVVASEILAVLMLAREKLKEIGAMLAATLLAFAPWLYVVWQASKINSDIGQNIGWQTKPNFLSVFQFIFDLFEPIYFQNSNRDSAAIILITLPIIAVSLFAFGFYALRWKNETAVQKRSFTLLWILILTPIVLAFAASWLAPHSIWGTRHLIIVFAPFTILLAGAFSKIEIRQVKSLGAAFVFLMFIAAFALQATRPTAKYIWCAWENLARGVNLNEPQTIYVFEDLTAYHFWFALRRDSDRVQIIAVKNIEGLKEDAAYFLPRGFDQVQTANQFEGERFYVAFRDKDFNRFAAPLRNIIQQGYEIGEPQIYEAQGLKAFLVEVRKGS